MNTSLHSLQIKVLDSFDALRELPWLASIDHGTSDFFCTASWFEILLSYGFDPSARLKLFVLEDADRPLACLPMVDRMTAEDSNPTTLNALSNYYSCLFAPLGSPELVPEAGWQQLCLAIKTSSQCWPIINLRPLDRDSSVFDGLFRGLRKTGYWVDSYFCFGNWYLPIAGRSYEQYLKSLTSKLRSNISRARRKLDAAGNWHISIQTASDNILDSAIDAFERVYAASWKQNEPYPEFIPNLCRVCAENGWLRLGTLYFDGQAIASQLWIVRNGRALIYKIAYDHAFASMSAGALLTAEMIRHAIDIDNVSEIDYLSGDDAYKRHWMSHRRERFGIIAFNAGTVKGAVAGIRHYLGRLARTLLQILRKRTADHADEKNQMQKTESSTSPKYVAK